MKKLLLLLVFIAFTTDFYSQNGIKSITLTPVVFRENSNQKEVTPQIRRLMKNKLKSIVTSQGLASEQFMDKNIIFPDIQVISKDVIPGMPPKVSLNIELTLYIADYDSKTVYSSETFDLKGVGRNEAKAYNNALKRLNRRNRKVVEFVNRGKEKILEYYKNNCDMVYNDAMIKLNSGREKEGLKMLTRIPYDNTDCYKKTSNAIVDAYLNYENKQCMKDLAKAQSIWNSSPNYEGALKTQVYFSRILPDTKCYDNALNIMSEMKKTLKEKDHREWEFKMTLFESKSEMLEHILNMIYDLEKTKAENSGRRYDSWWGK